MLAFGGRVFAAVLGFINAALSARLLGTHTFGLYSLALTMTTVATTIASGGLQNTLLVLLPKRRAESTSRAQETLRFTFWYAFGAAANLAVVVALLREEIAYTLGQPEAAVYLALMMFSLPFSAVLAALRAGAQSVFAFPRAILPMDVFRPVLLFVIFAVLLVVGLPDATWVPGAYTLAVALGASLATVALATHPAYGWSWLQPPAHVERDVIVLSLPFLLIAVLNNLSGSVMVFILGRTATASEVGLYSAAQRTASLVAFILVAVNMVFAPTISTLWTAGDRERLSRYFQGITRWLLAVSLPMCLLLIFGGPGVLKVFGEDFVGARSALAFLAVGQLVNAASGSVGYMLMLTGHRKTMVWNTFGTLGASVVLGTLVVPTWGATGAAAVAAFTVAAFNSLMLYQVHRKVGLFPYDRETPRLLLAGVFSAALAASLQGWAWSDATPWTTGLVVVAIVLGLSYALVFRLVAFRDADRRFLRQLVVQAMARVSRGVGRDR